MSTTTSGVGSSAASNFQYQNQRLNAPPRVNKLEIHLNAPPQGNRFDAFEAQQVESNQPKKKTFSLWNAFKNTVGGVIKPIKTMLKHPIKTAIGLGAIMAVASAAPVVVPILVVGGAILGAMQIRKGVKSAYTNYKNGNYEAAEHAFTDIGEGTFALASSVMGVRAAGAISAEARATTTALSAAKNSADRVKALEVGLEAAAQAKGGNWLRGVKEISQLFTRKDGRSAIYQQLNPDKLVSNLAFRGKTLVQMFTKSPVIDAKKALRTAQKHLNIAKKDMPKLEQNLIYKDNMVSQDLTGIVGGFYRQKTHSIHVQPDGFQFAKGTLNKFTGGRFGKFADKLPKPIQNFMGNYVNRHFPADEVIAHELTHARQALGVDKLTKPQAELLLKKWYPKLDSTVREMMLDGFRFAKENRQLSLAERQSSKEAFKVLSEATKASLEATNPLFRTKNAMRKYIGSVGEIEARQQAALLKIKQLSRLLSKKSLSQAEKVQITGQLRNSVHDVLLNQKLTAINELRAAGKYAEAAQQEALVKSLVGLSGIKNPTKSMYWQHQASRAFKHNARILGKNIAKAYETIRGRNFKGEPSEALGRRHLFDALFGSIRQAYRALFKSDTTKPVYLYYGTQFAEDRP